jgi:hypothetical protein
MRTFVFAASALDMHRWREASGRDGHDVLYVTDASACGCMVRPEDEIVILRSWWAKPHAWRERTRLAFMSCLAELLWP